MTASINMTEQCISRSLFIRQLDSQQRCTSASQLLKGRGQRRHCYVAPGEANISAKSYGMPQHLYNMAYHPWVHPAEHIGTRSSTNPVSVMTQWRGNIELLQLNADFGFYQKKKHSVELHYYKINTTPPFVSKSKIEMNMQLTFGSTGTKSMEKEHI